jgi:hypothetical protein
MLHHSYPGQASPNWPAALFCWSTARAAWQLLSFSWLWRHLATYIRTWLDQLNPLYVFWLLQEFWAEYNQLEGALPPEYGSMALLEKLVLNDNNLRGPVPATWGNLDNLKDIYLFNNPGLTGCLPAAWKNRLHLSPAGFQQAEADDLLRDGTAIKGFCRS